jgi:predicted P-loop ATPase
MTIIKMRESAGAKGYQVAEVNPDVIIESGLVTPGHGWCVWTAKWKKIRTDKPDKVPYKAWRKALSVSEPETWLTFEDARAGWDSRRFDGIGLLMSSAHGTVGVDLDKCLQPDGSISAGHEDIVSEFVALGGYTEISPSGRGLRQFLRGKALHEYLENNGAGLEVYDDQSTRYLTVTGQVWPVGAAVGAVVENQAALEAFIRRWGKLKAVETPATEKIENEEDSGRTAGEVLALLKTYNKRGKVTRLLAGDTSDYPGHSEADAALCFEAAYFCRNPIVIDEILRGSGLMREKWDSKRGKETYGALTIRNALNAQERNFDADQAEKIEQRNSAKSEQRELDDKGVVNLVGGIDDLRTPKKLIRSDLWSRSELLIRDKRLLGLVCWDSFANMPMVTGSFHDTFNDPTAPVTGGQMTDCHLRAVVSWFGREWKIALRPKEEIEIVMRWAQALRRNPLAERLVDCEGSYDGKARVRDWLITYCGAKVETDDGKDITEYVQAVGEMWLVSCVARAMHPGCKADAALVMEGKQGARKSSAVRALAESLGEGYFVEGFALGSGRDDQIKLRGRLIVEWAELSGANRRDVREIKNFLTLQTDTYRDVFGKLHGDNPRTAIFVATVNDSAYLSDPTGNRRFWPVTVGRINLDALRRDAPQLWGEAVALWRAGRRWWLDDHDMGDLKILQMAESEQFRRVGVGLWDEVGASLAERLVLGMLPMVDEVEAKLTNTPIISLSGKLLAPVRGNFCVDQMKLWLGGSYEGAQKIDDQVWTKAADGLKRAGWEVVSINGRRRYRLQAERRDELCKLHGVPNVPTSIKKLMAAEKEAAGALAKAKAAACA